MPPLDLELFPPVPEDTRIAALSVFPENNLYILVGDQLDSLFIGLDFVDQNPRGYLSVRTLAMLNLITIFQYVETIPDRRLSDSLRRRVDWKYALHLPLQYSGMRSSVFCTFRKRLCADVDRQKTMHILLFRLHGIMQESTKQPLPQDSTTILKRVCLVSRMANIWDAMSDALGALATDHPEWLSCVTQPQWYQRYSQRQRSTILASGRSDLKEIALEIGADGFYLMNAIGDTQTAEMAGIPEVIALKEVWSEQYDQQFGKVSWRYEDCIDCPRTNQVANP